MDKEIRHYGTPRHSGRYPWGSGDEPFQRTGTFRSTVKELRKQGMNQVDIAKAMGMNTAQLRKRITIERRNDYNTNVEMVNKLFDKGYSPTAISKRTGIPEPTVRSYRNPVLHERANSVKVVADMLKESVDSHKYVDVGVGVEHNIGVSRQKLKTAIAMLEDEGYTTHTVKTPQVGTGHDTKFLVLAKPGVEYKEILANKANIKQITAYTEDGGQSFRSVQGLEPVRSISSSKVKIRYAEEGGADMDGVIQLRRGVPELSLGDRRYAQVRIGVDGTHYLKGMAMYTDDIPDGIDVIYNSNKHSDTPKMSVFKKMERTKEGDIDMDNPFGSSVRQKHFIDKDGKEQLSAIQTMGLKEGSGEEGGWDKWNKALSSQFLSKQKPALAKKQLDIAYQMKKEEYDEIMSLTNPVLRKKLLITFGDECDSEAVHLKAAAMPRQRTQVILPLPNLKETEVYAPNFRPGEKVVLIRHPHGGIFEIPELTVNTKDPIGKKLLGQARDAIGIHPKVAAKLSGADFDGDTVIVIPNNNKSIKTAPAIQSLLDFNTRDAYPPYDGMKTIDGGRWNAKERTVDYGGKRKNTRNKQLEMGKISNLITDMTVQGADIDEIVRAVKHSMVVIDAEKHSLNYKQSYDDNAIGALKIRYQGKKTGGASTLISKAKSEERVPYRTEGKKFVDPNTGKTKRVYIDPNTGKKLYEVEGGTYTLKGKTIKRTTKVTKMENTDDAYTLSSGTPIESVYATHANKMKALGNQARLDALNSPRLVVSDSAKKTYAQEVSTLTAKLNNAKKNKPLERQALLIANSVVKAKKEENPDMTAEDVKKVQNQAIVEARLRVGAKKVPVEIEQREWEAIQAGAISNNKLVEILDNTDLDAVKRLATPRTKSTLTPAKLAAAKAKLNSGYTQAEVADSLGVSVTTLLNSI